MDDHALSLVEHLSELRKRLLYSVVALGISFVVLFNYSEHLFSLITLPLKSEITVTAERPYLVFKEKQAVSLVFLAPAEAFWMHLKVSFVGAFIVSLPVIFLQVWRFVSPGLLEKEKRYVLPFVVFASGLFLAGAAFCFLVVLPFALTFLLGYKVGTLTPMISVGSYVDFCLKFVLAFGAVFELPLALIFLTRIGLVTPATLAKNRKYAVLLAFIAAAVLTPTPDAFNQVLMAVPIIVLYEAGILFSRMFRRRKTDA
ncbi:MAG: twin-arginine translocase subunit TatC [Thermodesulfovibrionales bacterium]